MLRFLQPEMHFFRHARRLPAISCILILGFCPLSWLSAAEVDPLSDWAVQEGYSLKIAASGFSLPTAIAVIPDPKPDPRAPRLFVTELRGTIKTVANDGKLSDFARIETFKPDKEWPDDAGEAGMAGICLAPDAGYVFVTYTHRDEYGVLRNGLSRFTATPRTFEGEASDRRDYLQLFQDDSSAFSHQIGGCFVSGDSVFVSVGDGGDPAASRSLDKMLGKLLRLTLDGQPYPGNPFPSSGPKAASVYAYGLRNPFGLAVVDGRVFVAENGVDLDRFLELEQGRDYGWDGTDGSIAINAAAVFSPTICPVHVAYAPASQQALKPATNARFLIAVSDADPPGVISLEYDLDKGIVVGSPKYLVQMQSRMRGQGVVGLALAPEGLYFAPILPVAGRGMLMLTRYDPARAHARVIGRGTGPEALISTYGCLKCHLLNGQGGSQGPALDQNSLKTRVESRVLDPSYEQLIARLEAIPDKAIQANRPARQEVAKATPNDRTRLWIVNRLLFPRFDAPNAQMPSMSLTREQAESIASYLLDEEPPRRRSLIDRVGGRRFVAGIGLGLAAGFGVATVLGFRRRRRASATRPAAD
jgi:mono/diheme cytochrome c family protein